MSIYDEFDFRKKDQTLREKIKYVERNTGMDVEENVDNFSSKLQRWKTNDGDESNFKNLEPNFNFFRKDLPKITSLKQNPLFNDNPGFPPAQSVEKERTENNFQYYRQNEHIKSPNEKVFVQEATNGYTNEVQVKNNSDDQILKEFKRKYSDKRRDSNGWVHTGTPDNYIPGPSTQTLEYFARTPRAESQQVENTEFENPYDFIEPLQEKFRNEGRAEDELQNDANFVEAGHNSRKSTLSKKELKRKSSKKKQGDTENGESVVRSNSSRSNPNVTFGKKSASDISNELGVETMTHNELMASTQRLAMLKDEEKVVAVAPKVEHLFSPSTGNIHSQHETNMNNLNFTKMSANVRRSRSQLSSARSSKRTPSYASQNTFSDHNGSFISVGGSNTSINRYPSSRSRSTLSSNRSASKLSLASGSSVSSSKDRNTTTVLLAKGWSGKIVSSSESTHQVYDFGLNINPKQEGTNGKNLSGLVFRNGKPIIDVKPTDDKDALKSLRSLDRRLKVESHNSDILFKGSLDWMTRSQPSTPDMNVLRNPDCYRDSNCLLEDMEEMSKNILHIGWNEGQNMRVYFYQHLHKVTTIVNTMLQSIPKRHFPFEIKPLSFQGEFEKKGPYSIDLYLTLEGIEPEKYNVDFTLRKTLSAYVIHKEYDKELKLFSAQNAENGVRILSANNLMIVFAYIVNTRIRSEFAHDSDRKRKSIPFDAEISFNKVSEGAVRFDIFFPEENVTYDIGLQVALDIMDFPNVLNLGKKRRWPDLQTKSELIRHGVHLLAKKSDEQNHAWTVSFLKTRKVLLNSSDSDNNATTLLLALQVVNRDALSKRECEGLLLPVHFIMLLFWCRVKYQSDEDWSKENLAKRFVDLLIALKRCLAKKQCRDFFFPSTNYFDSFSADESQCLVLNINDVLNNPKAYIPTHENISIFNELPDIKE